MIKLSRLNTSFVHAIRGVAIVYSAEQSFRIQVFVSVLVLLLSVLLPITSFQFIVIMLLIGAILCLEMINSVFERMIDAFKPRIHPIVRDIKDIMAGTVFVMSIIAILVGSLIFLPHILLLFQFNDIL